FFYCFILHLRPPPISTLFPYTTLFRSHRARPVARHRAAACRHRMTIDQIDDGEFPVQPVADALQHRMVGLVAARNAPRHLGHRRSEEHTSELQSRENLVCRLLLEKKKK